MKGEEYFALEKGAGPCDVEPLDAAEIDGWRKRAYISFEQHLRRVLHEQAQQRHRRWRRDYSSMDAYIRSVDPMRRRLKEMFGFWTDPQQRAAPAVGESQVLLENDDFRARRFAIEVADGLESYGIELIPKHAPAPHRGLLVQHGWGGSPELVCGFCRDSNREDVSYRSLGLRAVRRGYHVVAMHHPYGFGAATDEIHGIPDQDPQQPPTGYGENRLHRMALLAGGTAFGLAMMTSSRGIDLLAQDGEVDPSRIGMYGLSQGGQSTLYLPAMDTRIAASVCSAYFNERLTKLIGPGRLTGYLDWFAEGQFFPGSIGDFSDADVVSLVAPRAFAVEAGVKDGAVDFDKAREEFARARVHYDRLGIGDRIAFLAHSAGHVSATRAAFDFLASHLGPDHDSAAPEQP